MKIKLNPSAKIKRRYILIDASSRDSVEKELLEALGTLGISKAKMVFVNPVNTKGIIISVERGALDLIRAALEISKENIKILRVSGTLKGLNK